MNIVTNDDEYKKTLKKYPLTAGILVTMVFSLILSINLILKVGDVCNDAGLAEIFILMIDFSIRFLSGAISVILIIPIILYFSINQKIFRIYIKTDLRLTKDVSISRSSLIGIISALWFFIICLLIAILLGVLNLDFNLILNYPTEGNVGWFIFIYALIPALWEEMTFRGVILHTLEEKYSDKVAILVSSLLFGLFHFTNLIFEPFELVFFYFIMSTLYGLAWAYLVVNCGNVLPAIIAHYLIDAFGLPFINIRTTDQNIMGTFFISISCLYPLITIIIFQYFFRKRILK